MTLNARGDPPRSTHQHILNEEHARVDHVIDVLPTCHCKETNAHTNIERRDFLEDTFGSAAIDVILSEAQTTLRYRRQRRNRGSDVPNSIR